MGLFSSSKEDQKKDINEEYLRGLRKEMEEINEGISQYSNLEKKIKNNIDKTNHIESKLNKIYERLEIIRKDIDSLNKKYENLKKESKGIKELYETLDEKFEDKKEAERKRVIDEVEKTDKSYKIIRVLMWILTIISISVAIILGIQYG